MNWKKNYPFLLLILLHLFLLSQLMFTVWPEMILYPYFLLNDFAPYKDIINPYFPLLPAILFGFFKIFGLSVLNLKILTWLIILFTDLVVIYSAKHFFNKQKDQLITLSVFILLQIYFGGNGLWFELMLTPFILVSLMLVYFYPGNIKKILFAGLFFSLVVLIKQNSILFFIPIGIFLILNKQIQSLVTFILTMILVLGVSAGVIFHFGIWNDFFNWAVVLPLSFTQQHGFVLLPAIRQYLLILFPILALIPFLLNKKFKIDQKLFWLFSFLIALQFAFPRYENFHLQVLAALSSVFAPMLPKKYLYGFMFLVVLLFIPFLIKNFHQPNRFIDSGMLRLSEKIKNYSSVYILNGSDLSYFFANKLPPKPWAINFPWYFEVNNFENKFIKTLKNDQTEYIVIGEPLGGGKYALGNYLPAGLMDYIQYNYWEIEKFENYQIWQKKLISP